MKKVADGFIANMDAVVCLAGLPDWILSQASGYLLEYEPPPGITRDRKDKRLQMMLTPPELEKREWIATAMPQADELIEWRQTDGSYAAAVSLLSAMITGAWTAFETAARDSWIAAQNTAREPRAKVWDRQFTHTADEIYRMKKSRSKIMWGDYLVSERKVQFGRLSEIRAAYRDAFESRKSKGN